MTSSAMMDLARIRRVWDVLEIKNLMSRHAYCHAYDMHKEELDELWVTKPENRKTASFGQNWGYQVGYDTIYKNYVELNYKWKREDLEELRTAIPELEVKPENYGTGSMLMHMITTPYVEVAGDGETAQGLWYSPGQVTVAHADHTDTLWMYERYAVDFIKEDGEWKIWHLFVGTDFCLPAGGDMTKEPVSDEPDALPADGEMDITIPVVAYTSRYNWSPYPPIPKPYKTFSETVSYGPDGNPAVKEGGGI